MAMAMTLDELTKALQFNEYTAMTEEEILQKAKDKYQAEADAAKLTAQQAYDKTALALDDQRSKLDASYAQQTEAAKKNTAQTYSAADRHALSRGMQRSTYNNSTLANINLQGDETLNKLAESLRADQTTIDNQKSLAAQQLAQQLAQYETDFNSKVNAYADQLREQDYQKQLAAAEYNNKLQAMLYEYGLTAKKSGGGGSSKPKTTDTTTTDTTTTDTTTTDTTTTDTTLDAITNYINPKTTTNLVNASLAAINKGAKGETKKAVTLGYTGSTPGAPVRVLK